MVLLLKLMVLSMCFENKYVIFDTNIPEATLSLIEKSGNFKRIYENRLYKIYKMR